MRRFIIGSLLLVICHLTFAQVNMADTSYYVLVTYNGSSATVEMTADVANFVTYSVNGAHVTVTSTASEAVNEITYGLTGTTTDGSFTQVGTYKATVELFGVSITNPSGPAIDLQNGKRIELSAKKETVSTLTDGTSATADAWKGALQCKGHIQFKGKGTLNVYGNYAHGIRTGEYIEVKNCTINVKSAVKDAVNCNHYFAMASGEMNLSGFGDDGIQVSIESDDTSSSDNTGNFSMTGGTINITMGTATGKAVKAEGTQSVASAATLNIIEGADAVENVQGNTMQTAKVIRDGRVVIVQGDKIMDISGNEIK